MGYTNTIGILVAAKDEASKVLAGVAAKSKETSAAMNGDLSALSGGSTKTADSFTTLGLAAGVAVAAIGVVAIKKAGDFQAQLTKLATSAGESTANLKMVGNGILQLARDTGTSATDLADAMYKIESGGQHGADGLTVLKAATQGAKAEGSDLVTVADAVTSAMVDYGVKADGAATLTSKLVAATAAGKMSFQDLAAALPSILPVASAAHVSLNDILGDMASMTVHGMTAQQAAQNLSNTIEKMLTPTATQAKELALLGMTTNQLGDDLKTKGLSGTLEEISQKIQSLVPPGQNKVILDLKTALGGLPASVQELGSKLFDGSMSMKEYNKAASALDPISAKQAISFATLAGSMHRIGDQQMSGVDVMQNYSQALYKATGDATALKVALMLTGDNAGTTTAAIKSVTDATADASGNVKGWSEIQGNFNTKLSEFVQWINTSVIWLGMKLLPVATGVLTIFLKLAQKVEDLGTKIKDHLMPHIPILSGHLDNLKIHLENVEKKLVAAGKAAEEHLLPLLKQLWHSISDDLIPALMNFWKNVLVPLEPMLKTALKDGFVIFGGAVALAVVALTDLLKIATPVINFLAANPGVVYGLAGAFIALKGAMMLQEAFNALQTGFLILQSNSIPQLMAQVTGLDTLIATPIIMPAIVITAALVALGMIWDAAMKAKDAIDGATKANDQMTKTTESIDAHFAQVVADGVSSPQAKANAKAYLHKEGVPGYALGTNFAPGGMAYVHKDELVDLPTGSKVYNKRDTQQMMGGRGASVTIGTVQINNQMDQQKFLADLGWKLANA